MTTKVQAEMVGFEVNPELNPTLEALSLLDAAAGLIAQTGEHEFAKRILTGTEDQITVTNGSGEDGNPILSLPIGAITSGSWTPTLTNSTNVGSSTTGVGYYIRIGDTVICWIGLSITPTAASGAATALGVSLPVAGTLATSGVLRGVASNGGSAQRSGSLFADTTNSRATYSFAAETTASTSHTMLFAYRIS